MNDKNADGQAGQKHGAAPSQEGHAAGPACSAPDEALIEEISMDAFQRWYNGDFNQVASTEWAIREYIRRSAQGGGQSDTVSVPREIDRSIHYGVLDVWNSCMINAEPLHIVWPKLVKAMLSAAKEGR